jgi:hypothetical protein
MYFVGEHLVATQLAVRPQMRTADPARNRRCFMLAEGGQLIGNVALPSRRPTIRRTTYSGKKSLVDYRCLCVATFSTPHLNSRTSSYNRRYFALIRAAVSSMYIVTSRTRWAYTICLSPQFGHCAWRTSSLIRARSVAVMTLTVTPHLQRHVANPLFINLGLLRQVAVNPDMGINPNIGTMCYGKEGITKTSDFGLDLVDS